MIGEGGEVSRSTLISAYLTFSGLYGCTYMCEITYTF